MKMKNTYIRAISLVVVLSFSATATCQGYAHAYTNTLRAPATGRSGAVKRLLGTDVNEFPNEVYKDVLSFLKKIFPGWSQIDEEYLNMVTLKKLSLKKGMRILILGMAISKLELALGLLGEDVTVVDIDRERINKIAIPNAETISLITEKIRSFSKPHYLICNADDENTLFAQSPKGKFLNITSHSCDIVTLFDIFEGPKVYGDKEKIINNALRALKSGGVIWVPTGDVSSKDLLSAQVLLVKALWKMQEQNRVEQFYRLPDKFIRTPLSKGATQNVAYTVKFNKNEILGKHLFSLVFEYEDLKKEGGAKKAFRLISKQIKLHAMNFYAQRRYDLKLFIEGELIPNSISAMEEKGYGKITVSCYKTKDSVIIEVKDEGVGISEEQARKSLSGEFKTDDLRGRGLFIINKIMKKYQGTISVKGKKGVGTVVTLVFPVENADEQIGLTENWPPGGKNAEQLQNKNSVLLTIMQGA